VINNLKNDSEIKSFLAKILKIDLLSKTDKTVIITNTITKEINYYKSKKEAAIILKADVKSIYNRDKLFRGIYKIEIIC